MTTSTVGAGDPVLALYDGFQVANSDLRFTKTSFNPTSLKVLIMGLIMCKYPMRTDGSCPDTRDSAALSNSGMTFKAFKLEDHAGTVTLGAQDYPYTASKR